MSESSFVSEDLKKQMIVRHSKIMESIHLHHVFFTAKFQSFQNLPSKARKFFGRLGITCSGLVPRRLTTWSDS